MWPSRNRKDSRSSIGTAAGRSTTFRSGKMNSEHERIRPASPSLLGDDERLSQTDKVSQSASSLPKDNLQSRGYPFTSLPAPPTKPADGKPHLQEPYHDGLTSESDESSHRGIKEFQDGRGQLLRAQFSVRSSENH
jgi:hypothetical protein